MPRDDRGATTVELIIASALMILIGVLFVDSMISMQRTIAKTTDRTAANDDVRLAVQDLDRQIRSGNIIHDPASETADPDTGIVPGYALRIYTQANAPTRTPASQCVQWRVHDGRLETRRWSNGWRTDGVVTSWRLVADGVVNEARGVQPFALDTDPIFGSRLLRVDVLVAPDRSAGAPVRVTASLTGRNTQFSYPTDVCEDIP